MGEPVREPRTLGHGDEADGIEEFDNALPTWWLGLFIGCVVWSGMYTLAYHVTKGRSQKGEYQAEMTAAEAEFANPVAATARAGAASPVASAGRAIFETSCSGCHGATATGGVGPNLTDATWIHGGTLADITRTITEGVPAKGMISWGPLLGAEKVAQVADYVHGLGGGQ